MRGIAVALSAALATTAAEASIVAFNSNPGLNGRGAFSGSMEWNHEAGASDGRLWVTLTNTSPLTQGGFLTGFAFNTVEGVFVAFNRDASEGVNARWRGVRNVNAPPYGRFGFGASVNGRFRGNGNPIYGVSVGRTFSYAFDVAGDSSLLDELNARSFLDEATGYAFVARFRGFDDGGSDMVTGALPAPGALALFGLGIGAMRRRSR